VVDQQPPREGECVIGLLGGPPSNRHVEKHEEVVVEDPRAVPDLSARDLGIQLVVEVPADGLRLPNDVVVVEGLGKGRRGTVRRRDPGAPPMARAVADDEGVIWLPYPPGGGEVSRLNQATAVAGTLTDGGVPQLVKVVTVFPTPVASVTTREVGRLVLGEMSNLNVASVEFALVPISLVPMSPSISVSVVPSPPVTVPDEVAVKSLIITAPGTVSPDSNKEYGDSPGVRKIHCPASPGAALAGTPNWSSRAGALPSKYRIWLEARSTSNCSVPKAVGSVSVWVPSFCPASPVVGTVVPPPSVVVET
jgi:hypothetical protein